MPPVRVWQDKDRMVTLAQTVIKDVAKKQLKRRIAVVLGRQ
jgi:hypothetical protein